MIRCKVIVVIRIKRFSPTAQAHKQLSSLNSLSLVDDLVTAVLPGLTNSMNFTEIRRIWSSNNFKINKLLFMDSKYLKNKKIYKKVE
jgi:hypothetical protein